MRTVLVLAIVTIFATPAFAGADCYVVDRFLQCFGNGAQTGSTMFGSTVAGTTRLYATDAYGNSDTLTIQNNNLLNDEIYSLDAE